MATFPSSRYSISRKESGEVPRAKGRSSLICLLRLTGRGGISYAQGLRKQFPKACVTRIFPISLSDPKEATCQAHGNAAQSPVQVSMDFTSHPDPTRVRIERLEKGPHQSQTLRNQLMLHLHHLHFGCCRKGETSTPTSHKNGRQCPALHW